MKNKIYRNALNAYTKKHINFIHEKISKKRSRSVVRWPLPIGAARLSNHLVERFHRLFDRSK